MGILCLKSDSAEKWLNEKGIPLSNNPIIKAGFDQKELLTIMEEK